MPILGTLPLLRRFARVSRAWPLARAWPRRELLLRRSFRATPPPATTQVKSGPGGLSVPLRDRYSGLVLARIWHEPDTVLSAWESDRITLPEDLTWRDGCPLLAVADPWSPGLMARQWPDDLGFQR